MDEETGVTTMVMGEKMDAGDILLMATTPVDSEETASMLHDRLSLMAPTLLLKPSTALNRIRSPLFPRIIQTPPM